MINKNKLKDPRVRVPLIVGFLALLLPPMMPVITINAPYLIEVFQGLGLVCLNISDIYLTKDIETEYDKRAMHAVMFVAAVLYGTSTLIAGNFPDLPNLSQSITVFSFLLYFGAMSRTIPNHDDNRMDFFR